jgi:hypothetical protein
MLDVLLIAAAATLLAPVAHRVCEGKPEREEESTEENDGTSYGHSYGSSGSKGERQTSLDEF